MSILQGISSKGYVIANSVSPAELLLKGAIKVLGFVSCPFDT
jgi:hypothetical protein